MRPASNDRKKKETDKVQEMESRRKETAIWVMLGLIVAGLVFFVSNRQYLWVLIFSIIGVFVLTYLKGFYWRQHLFPILAGILLLGSWIAQNTEKAEWSAEKDHVETWLQFQQAKFVDLGQWQVAVQQYRYPYEKMHNWRDTLRRDRNYAALCKNWLQLYYSFIMIDSQISMDIKRSYKLEMQRRFKAQVNRMNGAIAFGDYRYVVDLYDSEMAHSFHVIGDSGNRVVLRIEELENEERTWNEIFKWFYVAGSLLLAVNYVAKEIVKDKKI